MGNEITENPWPGWASGVIERPCVDRTVDPPALKIVPTSAMLKGRFAVHEVEYEEVGEVGWRVTHVSSGFRCFDFLTSIDARDAAEILESRYGSMFDAVKIGTYPDRTIEHFKPLNDAVRADKDLQRIRLYNGICVKGLYLSEVLS